MTAPEPPPSALPTAERVPEADRDAAVRAYLDLWERNLVRLAATGPVAPPRR